MQGGQRMITAWITLRSLYHPNQVNRIKEYLYRQDGVEKDSVYVWYSSKQVVVTFNEDKLSIGDVIIVLEKLGHPIFKFRLSTKS